MSGSPGGTLPGHFSHEAPASAVAAPRAGEASAAVPVSPSPDAEAVAAATTAGGSRGAPRSPSLSPDAEAVAAATTSGGSRRAPRSPSLPPGAEAVAAATTTGASRGAPRSPSLPPDAKAKAAATTAGGSPGARRSLSLPPDAEAVAAATTAGGSPGARRSPWLSAGAAPVAAPPVGGDGASGDARVSGLSRRWRVQRSAAAVGLHELAAPLAVAVMSAAWAVVFAVMAVERHLAGGSHAEDLGFTDQVLSNFLRGQWFRMSIYQGASWNTELDISRIARPDSLLAFHVEPMLLLLVPVYALGGGISALLVLQAVALAAGAIPAYRLARHATRSALAGVAVVAAYLLSPLGQWAVLADFHSSTLAAPLLLLTVERLIAARAPKQAVAAAALALTAREDVGPVVAALGVTLALSGRAFASVTWPSRERHASVTQASHGPVLTAGASRDRHAGVTPAAGEPAATAGASHEPHAGATPAAGGPAATAGASRERHAGVTSAAGEPAPTAGASRDRHAGVTPTAGRPAATAGASRERHAGVTQVGVALAAMGVAWTAASLAIIHAYSGGVTPFEVRYGSTLLAGPEAALGALTRTSVLGYVATLALSGGWLGVLSPLALVPALPNLALNVWSASPWMAAGRAHYSGLVLPFIAVAAAAGLGRVRRNRGAIGVASIALIGTSILSYVEQGAGPGGANYAPASVDAHAQRAASLAARLPPQAVVSASSALVPRVSGRSGVYVFPAVLDADFVFLDLRSSPAPTSAGDVHLRVQSLLQSGEWRVEAAEDGLLVLRRWSGAAPVDVRDLFAAPRADADRSVPEPDAGAVVLRRSSGAAPAEARDALAAPLVDARDLFAAPRAVADRSVREPDAGAVALADAGAVALPDASAVALLDATLLPSPDGAIGVDGPHSILRTTWRAERALAPGTRLEFWVELQNGERWHIWDIASLWWNPPERWTPGQLVQVDVPDIPARQFRSWRATWSRPR